jgi:hypothetical protein
LEALLKGRTYAAADNFTVADICLCVTVSQIEAFGFELVPYKNIRAWLKKCKEELEPFGYEVKKFNLIIHVAKLKSEHLFLSRTSTRVVLIRWRDYF